MPISKLVSPLCLLLAMLMLLAAFIVFATDAPTEGVRIHQARADGNEMMETALKDDLFNQVWLRRLLLAALFCGSIFMAWLAFFSMRVRS